MKKICSFVLALGISSLLSVFLCSGTVLAKSKDINYRKEFSKYLQWVVDEQKIDKNHDGRLSSKEINVVSTLVLNNPNENEKNRYSLSGISTFKNLQELHIECTVKNLTPLYSLKKLNYIEFGYNGYIEGGKTDFSKIKNLKTLISANETLGDVVDLRKNSKLKTLEVPSGTNEVTKYYLPDRVQRLGGITNPAYSVYIGNKKSKAVLFYKMETVMQKENAQNNISCLKDLCIIKNKKYTIKNLDVVSGNNKRSIRKVLGAKNVKWECMNKNASIKKGKVRFKKAGWYTLIGYEKNKRYIINLEVVNKELKKLSQNYKEVVIFDADGKTITISESNVIAEVCSKINSAGYQVTFSSVRSAGNTQNSYKIVFKDSKGNWLRTLEVNDGGLIEFGVSYKCAGSADVALYIRNAFETTNYSYKV